SSRPAAGNGGKRPSGAPSGACRVRRFRGGRLTAGGLAPGRGDAARLEEAGSRRAGWSPDAPTPIHGEMPVPRRLIEFEFSPAALVRRIVRGAVDYDMVRMPRGMSARVAA